MMVKVKEIETPTPRVVELDPILEELGAFGRFQVLNYGLMLLPLVFTAVFTTSYVFTAAEDPHRCLITECESENDTVFAADFLAAGDWTRGQCERRQRLNDSAGWPGSCDSDLLDDALLPCETWLYRDRLTIVSEFNIGCSEWKRTLVGTVQNIGQLVCLPLTGIVSDRWGRRTALVLGVTLSGVIGLIKSFSPTYIVFLLLEFLDPALGSGVYSSAFILAVELVGPQYRVIGGSIVGAYYAVGEIILGLIAWAVPYWRNLLRVVCGPSLLIIAYFWLAPESVRWLLAKGRASDAKKQLDRAAGINKVNLSEKSLENLSYNIELEKTARARSEKTSDSKQESIRDALRSGRLVLRVVCCSWMWITCTLLYYGISLSAATLAGDKYANFVLVSLVELPAHAATLLVLARAGRRPALSASFLVGGMACLAFAVVPEGLSWLSMTCYLVGKFSITIAFTVVYVYTAELFPTSLRHSLLAACSMLGRIGSIVAPQAPLLATVAPYLPSLTFGATALLAGGLVLTLPETRGRVLPDTVQDALRMRQPAGSPPDKIKTDVTSL